jgi:hypothetical protein
MEGQLMQINTPNLQIVWNGSHTANVYNYLNNELDVFTFSFEKNKPTAIDFVNATIAHLSYVEAS